MGIFDNLKSFVHSITTDDHYASYDSPYRTNVISNSNLNSSARLNELNGSTTSLDDGSRPSFAGYRPGLRSSSTNLNGSDLQLQNLNQDGQPPLPSVDSLWDRIEAWLDDEYPELADNLNDGVTTADLNEFENDLGCGAMPVEFRQMYKRHDGQFRGGKPTGLFLGLVFLDLESIVEEHAIWSQVAQKLEKQQYILQQQQRQAAPPNAVEGSSAVEESAKKLQDLKLNNSFIAHQRSIPPNSIQPYYSHKAWIPICRDYFGNQIAIDVAPGPSGHYGQVIIFGRDYDTKLVIASSLQEFLFGFVNDLENGKYKIDQTEIDTSYGFLETSRNDNEYMIGDEDEGQGDLVFWDPNFKEFGKQKNSLTYLEALKRRALKKYGITNVDRFLTQFVPQNPKRSAPGSKVTSPVRTPNLSNTDLSKAETPLVSVDSTSQVNLPKETIIDEKKPPVEKSADKPAEKSEKPAEKSEPEPAAPAETATQEEAPAEPVDAAAEEKVESTEAESDLKKVDL